MSTRPISVASLCAFATVLIAIASALPGCGNGGGVHSDAQTETSGIWQYPVHLGDSRAKVHELLGGPYDQTLDYREAYPASGVEVWFDPEGRVSKFSFVGEASALYQTFPVQIRSDRNLMLG